MYETIRFFLEYSLVFVSSSILISSAKIILFCLLPIFVGNDYHT